MGGWVTLLRVATSIAQCGMILSPGPDIYNVHKSKGTGEMAALPLVAMVVNNYLWYMLWLLINRLALLTFGLAPRTVYGYLTDSVFPLMVTQLFGEIASIVFTAIYYRWCADRRALHQLLAGGMALCTAFTIYIVLGVTGVTRQNDDQVGTTLGYVGLVINLWMYASPLGTIRHVIKTKSAASLPINISVMMLFNTVFWVALAIVDNDLIIMSLNITGILLSITQIAVYMRFRPRRLTVAQDEAFEFTDTHISIVASPKDGGEGVKSPVYQPLASPIEKTRV
ncbi:hypothetical protein PRIC1_004843 [Phytophthora ramorum]